MTHNEAVDLIRGGVNTPGGTWADLGSGSGTFSHALSALLGPSGQVIAVDHDRYALEQIGQAAASRAAIEICYADFIAPLELADLDGVLLANSLHFVERQAQVLRQIVGYLKPGGQLLVVEYDTRQRSPWNPHPLPPNRLQALVLAADLKDFREINRRPSRFGARELYAAVAFRP